MIKRLGVVLAMAATLLAVSPAQAAPPAGWALIEDDKGRACTASRQPQAAPDNRFVNTHAMRNGRNHMLLVAARGDWDGSGSRMVSLAIDSDAPVSLEADAFGPLVVAEITDAAVERKLRDARILTWILPTGRYTADVTGLGAAYDLTAACN